NIGDGIHFLLPEVTPAAHVPDYILGLKHVGVEQCKLADAGHSQLERNLSAARTAPGNERTGVAERPDIKKWRNARKKLMVIHSEVPPAAAIGRTCAMFGNCVASAALVSMWRKQYACQDSSRS